VSEDAFYKLSASTVLWMMPVMFAGLLVDQWQTAARFPLIFIVALTVAVRAWVRVGSITVSAHHHFDFAGAGYDESGRIEDIAWVLPIYRASGRVGFWLALRPVLQRPLLLSAPIPDSTVRSWVQAGVRVLGLSLEDEKRGDDFFKR
jgi:hypothetical protein